MMTALAVPGGLMRPDYDEGDAAAAQARALAGDADVQRRASSDTIPPGRLSASWATPTSAVLGGGGWPILVSRARDGDRKSTRLNSSHPSISYAVFCLKKKKVHLYRHNRGKPLRRPLTLRATRQHGHLSAI